MIEVIDSTDYCDCHFCDIEEDVRPIEIPLFTVDRRSTKVITRYNAFPIQLNNIRPRQWLICGKCGIEVLRIMFNRRLNGG